MSNNSNNAIFSGIVNIIPPLFFSFVGLQINVYPRIRLEHKLIWRAINEKTRAVNIHNALKNSVIVILHCITYIIL